MDIIKVFGSNLRKYRLARGLSQEEFASNVRLTPHLYQRD